MHDWYDTPRRPARRVSPHLPAHFALTDPVRFPDTLAFAEAVPPGWGFVYRHFGSPDRREIAESLAGLARVRGWLFLIAADPDLAAQCGADGVHWPEKRIYEAASWGRQNRESILTLAAHSPSALRRAAQARADAVFLSPVCATHSPGSGQALGWLRAASMARTTWTPAYALGGVMHKDAPRARRLGFQGIAMISGLVA